MAYFGRGYSALQRKRQFEEDMMFCSDDSSKTSTPESQTFSPEQPTYPHQRKRRLTSATQQSNSSTATNPFPLSSFGSPARGPAPKIKTEQEVKAHNWVQEIPAAERVRIYVGPKNAVFTVGVKDLDKSAVLKSLMNQDTQGPYIMHPELAKLNADHFQSVFQYLLMDEYMPAIVSNPNGSDKLPKQLDGLTTEDDYRNEVLRAGHVYVVAKGLGITSLQDLILRKITQAQYQPYGIKCQLDLAMIVFSRPDETELVSKGKFKSDTDPADAGRRENYDALEDWLIESLKDKLQPVLIQHAQLFFRVANHGACAKRGFGIRVFKRKVEEWEKLGGDVVAIEDDE